MLNLIIFGSPGAGKGTQAALIAKKYRLIHLSSGDLLRQELANGELGAKIKKYQSAGKLVPDALIIKMVEAAIKKNIKGAGFIFDGYPRNIQQAKSLNKFFTTNNLNFSLILNLKLSEKIAAQRILLRGRSSGRTDDNPKTIKKRFHVYREETKPILDYYKKDKKLINIDGEPDIKLIFRSISEQIKNIKK